MALAVRIPRIPRRKRAEAPKNIDRLELEIYMLLELGFPAA